MDSGKATAPRCIHVAYSAQDVAEDAALVTWVTYAAINGGLP